MTLEFQDGFSLIYNFSQRTNEHRKYITLGWKFTLMLIFLLYFKCEMRSLDHSYNFTWTTRSLHKWHFKFQTGEAGAALICKLDVNNLTPSRPLVPRWRWVPITVSDSAILKCTTAAAGWHKKLTVMTFVSFLLPEIWLMFGQNYRLFSKFIGFLAM